MGDQHTKPGKRVLTIALWARVLAGIGVIACSSADDAQQSARRDSLGIEIVESPQPLWQDGRAWYLSPTPEIQIGASEGSDEQQLYRVYSALRLSEDRILIANSGSGELRFYDRKGRLLTTAGGQGAGPGEFGQFAGMHTWLDAGGNLVSYDGGNKRVNVFESTGAFVRTVHFEQTTEAPRASLSGMLDEGRWFAGRRPEGVYCAALPVT